MVELAQASDVRQNAVRRALSMFGMGPMCDLEAFLEALAEVIELHVTFPVIEDDSDELATALAQAVADLAFDLRQAADRYGECVSFAYESL